MGMGRQLYETQPLFRDVIDQCDAILRTEWGESLLAVLYPELLDDIVQSALSRKELQSALLRDVGFKALFR